MKRFGFLAMTVFMGICFLSTPTLAQDADGDGLPDSWESLYWCMQGGTVDDQLDYDSDGLSNLKEYNLGTNPCEQDTDFDGLCDGAIDGWTCLTGEDINADGIRDPGETDPLNPDTDGDGLNDFEEVYTWGTDPLDPDTDGGGEMDGSEVMNGRNPLFPGDDYDIIQVGFDLNTPWNWPLSTYFHDARTQTIYKASEIGMSGELKSISFFADQLPGQAMNYFYVRFQYTALDAYDPSPGFIMDGWTVVYYNSIYTVNPGWNTITLSQPFYYNGVDNLIVDISFNNSSYTSDGYVQATDTGSPRSVYYRCDSCMGNPAWDWMGDMPGAYVGSLIPNLRFAFGPYTDSDGDGMPDWWEQQHPCMMPWTGDSLSDYDGDSLGNLAEYNLETNPCVFDTDGDSLGDGFEVNTLGTNPANPDTDGDLMPDGFEVLLGATCGMDPLANDALADLDGDSLTNIQEYTLGTLPCDPDSDGDGLDDGEEYYQSLLSG